MAARWNLPAATVRFRKSLQADDDHTRGMREESRLDARVRPPAARKRGFPYSAAPACDRLRELPYQPVPQEEAMARSGVDQMGHVRVTSVWCRDPALLGTIGGDRGATGQA